LYSLPNIIKISQGGWDGIYHTWGRTGMRIGFW
jgi:hypothetical protein